MTITHRGARLLAVAIALACPAAALGHGEVAYRLAAPPDQANVRSAYLEASYRVMSDLALRCPTSRQPEVMAGAEAIYQAIWGWRPSPPTADEMARLTADTRTLWRLLEREYPTVSVTVNASSITVAPHRAIPATRGMERYLLLRLANLSGRQRTVSIQVGAGVVDTANLPAATDEPAYALVPLLPRSVGRQLADLRLVEPDGPALGVVRVALQVTEPALLRGRVLDAAGNPWPGRVHVQGSDRILRHGKAFAGNSTLSEKPVVFRPASYRLPFFYSDGTFEVAVPAGPARVTLERGFEDRPSSVVVALRPGEVREVTLSTHRAIDMARRGWISGDTHVHWVRNSWDINEELGLLGMVQRAEDVRVVNNLTLYQFRTAEQGGVFIKPDQCPMGPVPGMCGPDWHVQMAEEYRNDNHYGHINLLGLQRLIEPIATGAGSGGPAGALDFPTNRPTVREARRQGGISVEAHNLGPFMASAVAANVVLGLSDSLDQIDPEHYYRFLNCGIQIGLSNGSDHPARVVGCARVYARMPGREGKREPFSYARWLEAVRRGRTFTTSGPLLLLKVNGAEPGDTLDLQPGATLRVELRAWSRYPLGKVELVSNGETLRSVRTSARTCTIRMTLRADGSRWFCGRASRGQVWNAILAPDVAHTSAVYTRVGGREVLRAEAARSWIANLRIHQQRLVATGAFANDEQRKQAVAEAQEGIDRYEQIAAEAARQPAR